MPLLEPRLSSDPVPLPPTYQRGAYADAAAVYDLDRVAELPWARDGFPPPTADSPAATLEAQRLHAAHMAAYCCWGLVDSAGQRLAGTPGLDDVAGWLAESRVIVAWIATRGLAGPTDLVNAPFQAAATATE